MKAKAFLRFLAPVLFAVLLLTPHLYAQTASATFTYPLNGATSVDTTLPFLWTSISNAQAYYLYVGTTLGAKDLVNTGEIQATSYFCLGLPTAQTLYARIWTKISGVWYYNDISFIATTSVKYAQLSYPQNGATGIKSQATFQWNSVPNAQSYYLYVGTTPGGKDLANSGWIPKTSFYVSGLPANQTLYARIYTKINNTSVFSDSTFTTGQSYAGFAYPQGGATNVKSQVTFKWNAITNAQAYYLYVGTTKGAKDLVNSGEIQTTSCYFAGLPANQTLYARIYTKMSGVWYYNDVTFTTGNSYAAFIYPQDGSTGLSNTFTFKWTSIANAQAYYLYIGTSMGARDLVDTGEIMTTSRYVSGLPTGQTLYARIWTKMSGVWYYNDVTFTTGAQNIAAFIYPQGGATGVDTTLPFQWTSVSNAQAYYLYIGSTQGAKDLYDSGEIQVTSRLVAGLHTGQTIYARIYTKLNGTWYYNDISFTASTSLPYASFTYPLNGETDVKLSNSFSWTPIAGVQVYELLLGTTPGGRDLYDSGQTTTTKSYCVGYSILPRQKLIYGSIWSKIDDSWYHSDIQFMMNNPGEYPATEQVSTALQMVSQVRAMADANNNPYSGTLLYSYVASRGKQQAVCLDYAAVLDMILYDNYVGDARILNVAMDTNGWDGHTLVELFNQNQQSWMLLDPTFTLTAMRTADGQYATAEDIQNSALNFSWNSITYDFLTSSGNAPATSYSIDYPLLYLNVCRPSSPCISGTGNSPLPYMQQTLLPYTGSWKVFNLMQQGGGTCSALVNGTATTFQCNGIDFLSSCFGATSIAASPSSQSAIDAYMLNRYVFPLE